MKPRPPAISSIPTASIIVGTILNGFDPASEGKSSYYKSYYRYQAPAEEENAVSGLMSYLQPWYRRACPSASPKPHAADPGLAPLGPITSATAPSDGASCTM